MTYQAHCCAYISLRNEQHLRIFSYKPNLTRGLSVVAATFDDGAACHNCRGDCICVFSVFVFRWQWSWQWQHVSWHCEGVICYLCMPQRVASCVALITCCLAMTWFKCTLLVATAAARACAIGYKIWLFKWLLAAPATYAYASVAFVTIIILIFFCTVMLHLNLLPEIALIKYKNATKGLRNACGISAPRNKCLWIVANVQQCACHHCCYGKKFA